MPEFQACAFGHMKGCLLATKSRVLKAYRELHLVLLQFDADGRILLAVGDDSYVPDLPPWEQREGDLIQSLTDAAGRGHLMAEIRDGVQGPLELSLVGARHRYRLSGSRVVNRDEIGRVDNQVFIGTVGPCSDVREPGVEAQSRSHLKRVLEGVPHFIGWTDSEGRFGFLNRSGRKLIGLDDGAAIPDFGVLFPDIAGPTGAGELVADTSLRCLGGEEIPVSLQVLAERDEQDVPLGATVIVRDIRERLRQEELRGDQFLQMAQAQRMASLGVLVASVAHEINNPNNFVMFNAPILRRIWDDVVSVAEQQGFSGDTAIGRRDWAWAKETVPRLLGGIENGAERIKAMVAQLRNYTRSPQDKQRSDVDCNVAVGAAIELVDHVIRKSTRHMVVAIPEDLPRIAIPAQSLEQIVLNLVVNACQALDNPGQAVAVTARYSPGQHRVHLSVQDEGRGIPPEILERLGSGYVTTKAEGTGLGLAIVRRILDQYGGVMNIVSTPGLGTTVTLVLPEVDHGG